MDKKLYVMDKLLKTGMFNMDAGLEGYENWNFDVLKLIGDNLPISKFIFEDIDMTTTLQEAQELLEAVKNEEVDADLCVKRFNRSF